MGCQFQAAFVIVCLALLIALCSQFHFAFLPCLLVLPFLYSEISMQYGQPNIDDVMISMEATATLWRCDVDTHARSNHVCT